MPFPTPFGPYEIQELLGRGGMGEVYRAFDREHERVVALKLLSPSLAVDRSFAEQFLAECHAAAQLTEPHVVPVHRFGMIEGRLYIDMRLVDGENLTQLISREAPLPAPRAVSLVLQAARALDAAHAAGLVHRDVKPSNLVVTPHDFACLVDFGLARRVGTSSPGQQSGLTVGTFGYMAPERFRDDGEVDARADVYALACVLFETLTGRPPFPFEPGAELMRAHLEQPPPRITDVVPSLPPELDDVIARGMAKDPDDRYPSAGALAAAAAEAVRSWRPAASDAGLDELLLPADAVELADDAPDPAAVVRPGARRRSAVRWRSAVMAGAVGLGAAVVLGGTAALGAGLLPTGDSSIPAAVALPSTSAAAAPSGHRTSRVGHGTSRPQSTGVSLATMAAPGTTAPTTAPAPDAASGATSSAVATPSSAPPDPTTPPATATGSSAGSSAGAAASGTAEPTNATPPSRTTTPTTAPTDPARPTSPDTTPPAQPTSPTPSPTTTPSPTPSPTTSPSPSPTPTTSPSPTTSPTTSSDATGAAAASTSAS